VLSVLSVALHSHSSSGSCIEPVDGDTMRQNNRPTHNTDGL
jgi:hypothetical protein